MSYDNDDVAAGARVEALEEQLAEKEAELARFKAEHPDRSERPGLSAWTSLRRHRSLALAAGAVFLVFGVPALRRWGGEASATKPTSDVLGPPLGSCTMGDWQSTPLVNLEIHERAPDGTPGWSLSMRSRAGSVRGGYVEPFPPGSGGILPMAGEPAEMGMACDSGILVLVEGNKATAWSTYPHLQWMWNATLPSPWFGWSDWDWEPTPEGLPFKCVDLDVEDGMVMLRLDDGPHELSLETGAVR